MKYSIVIPAYNEEESIGTVLRDLQSAVGDEEMIVVDDCSTDKTAEIVRSFAGVKLVQHPVNQGPIAAIMNGMKAAAHDVVVTLDADGQHPLDQIPQLLEPLRNNTADIVFGVRESLPRLGEKLIALNAGMTDATTGFRAMKKEHAGLFQDEFSYGGVFILRAKKRGYRVVEVPIAVKERMGGFSVHSNVNIFKKSVKLFLWSCLNGLIRYR